MSSAQSVIEIAERGQNLSQKTICLKIHLGLLGNSRKVNNSQGEADADKSLIRVSKNLLDSKELQAVKTLDGEIRQFLYNTCLPFETRNPSASVAPVPSELPKIQTLPFFTVTRNRSLDQREIAIGKT